VKHDLLTNNLRAFYAGVLEARPTMRAYSAIINKALETKEDGTVILRGTATTPTPDRQGDIVEPLGALFQLPLALLWQHFSDMPVGHVTDALVDPNGIPFRAEIPKPSKSSALKERYDEAVESIELGLVRAVSIGFRPLQDGMEVIDRDRCTLRFTKWEWLELSLVTIPANAEATIDNIKHYASAGPKANALSVVRLSNADLRAHHTRKNATYL